MRCTYSAIGFERGHSPTLHRLFILLKFAEPNEMRLLAYFFSNVCVCQNIVHLALLLKYLKTLLIFGS